MVNKENCVDVAQRIIKSLMGKNFSIVSFYHDPSGGREPPTILDRMWLSGDCVFHGGYLEIGLYPRRRIFWDLDEENVSINFIDDGNIIIERALPKGRTIYRALISSG